MGLFETPLEGLNLVEASAGTGKTYTISGLYLRLVVELGLSVDKILVVTYTKAATAELRERIRRLLVDANSALENGSTTEKIGSELIRRCADRRLACRRLQLAILDFDRANISTIHGFCQRMLADHAFESGAPFDTEILADQRRLVQEVVDDFWRLRVQDLAPGLIDYLLVKGFSPDGLASVLQGRLGRIYLERRGRICPREMASLEEVFHECFVQTRDCWRCDREAIGRLLIESDGLHRGRYPKGSIGTWMQAMDSYLGDEPGPWFEQFEKFCSTILAAGVKRGGEPPLHRFFDHCDRLKESRTQLLQAYDQARVALLDELFAYTGPELSRRKNDRGIQSYDDMLVDLHQALAQDREGALAEKIRNSCRAALIDEFQDTDPLQYEIFHAVFGDGRQPVFLVGDPKQAIYSFRGADLFAYLRAGQNIENRYELTVNWRSTTQLVSAINIVFKQFDSPFYYSDIKYSEVRVADKPQEPLNIAGEDSSGLCLEFLSGPLTKEQAMELSSAACAAEIARLLALGANGVAGIGTRPLSAGDIAVLVRSHIQGDRVRQALEAHGIHSVQHSQVDVFSTASAASLELVLRAIAEPGREGLVLTALATDIIGCSGEQIRQTTEREGELEAILDGFRNYRQLWLEHGFMRMFRWLLWERGVAERLLGREQGERRLTDLLHVAELLHQQERSGRYGVDLLVSWLTARRQTLSVEDESAQLRLESDERLVQIVTVHKSKGLQYPVVFYPFGWDASLRSIGAGQPYEFHDPEKDNQAVLELGSERWEQDRVYAGREALAESIRLLYVALTRAQQRCYLYWGDVNGASGSALAWLLFGSKDVGDQGAAATMKQSFRSLGSQGLYERLRLLADSSAGAISLGHCQLPSEIVSLAKPGPDGAVLGARHPARGLQRARRVTSFSALASGRGGVELPDHDGGISQEWPEPLHPSARDIFGFPRGAVSGSCVHAIFEQLDFSTCERTALESLVTTELTAFGIDTLWTSVVSDMVEKVLSTPLQPGQKDFCLKRLPRDRCLVEMGFIYPLSALDGTGLASLLTAQGFAGDHCLEQALGQLSFSKIEGYMKGFIDLVFEMDGRFYLADYKSNWLGVRIEDYAQQRLTEAMAAEHYYLQYLFYALAVHRYLRRRISDYTYDRHFGAVYYLFVRGMSPELGPDFGVYRTRPSKTLIEAMDNYIGQGDGVQR
ncbi:MAG: exodeoxyribonuclease V subunit beta [Gammaproteobacteria bacterium]|nr:exodeoxyribonuclease V subunit beta [Gammaproteobacteria bacterium]